MGIGNILGGLGGVIAAPFTGGASLAPMLIGAGVGAAKHFGIDKPAEKRQRELAAETIRYSPWTKMQAAPVKDASLFGSVLQGGALGAAAGEAIGNLGTGAASSAANAAKAPSLGVASQFTDEVVNPATQAGEEAMLAANNMGALPVFTAPAFRKPQFGAGLGGQQVAWNMMGGR